MFSRAVYYLFFILLLIWLTSCRVRKEYIERNGLHSDDKPSKIAKELGSLSKKQKRAYKKQLRRTDKAIKKRNREKIKGNYFDK